ncbi:MAG: hypothetical protein A2V67_18840 [Deltaproteobacteria bacterium RBG_13_61_14]|nr:MAG: hypothetical protein A2V67_18840 [Deltaproteobacteria bacterium RBG_13_61_14]
MEAILPEKQRRFIEQNQGMCKGRYHISYLVILGIAGGEELKQKALEKVGRTQYRPDEMYPTQEACAIVLFGAENGVPPFRTGTMVAQAFKRAQPQLFQDLSPQKMLDILCQAYALETDYGSTVKVLERGPNRAIVERKNNPMPCEFFQGVIQGVFAVANLAAEVKEIRCQWREEVPSCWHEVTWSS